MPSGKNHNQKRVQTSTTRAELDGFPDSNKGLAQTKLRRSNRKAMTQSPVVRVISLVRIEAESTNHQSKP